MNKRNRKEGISIEKIDFEYEFNKYSNIMIKTDIFYSKYNMKFNI